VIETPPPNDAHALWHHHVGGAHFWLPFSLVVCAASQLHGFATGLLSALPERHNADLVQQIGGGVVMG
jgi:hypothetical protein